MITQHLGRYGNWESREVTLRMRNFKYFIMTYLSNWKKEVLLFIRRTIVFTDLMKTAKCRKPKLGMIKRAMEDFDIDLENSIIIGDRDDMEGEMGRQLGIEYRILKR